MSNYIVKVFVEGDWEQLIDPTGKVIAESHHLDVEDVLEALGIEHECDYIAGLDEDE